ELVPLAEAPSAERVAAVRALLAVIPAHDRNVRGAGVLDPAGRVVVATEDALLATVIDQPYARDAAAGTVISDVHVHDLDAAADAAGGVPTIAYAARGRRSCARDRGAMGPRELALGPRPD